MIIERVDDFKWIEGTEDDFKIEGVSENAPEAQRGREENEKAGGLRKYRNLNVNVNQKKMNNKLLSQITTFTNVEKEKISYLNYSPPTIDDSSSDMSLNLFLA